MDEPTAGRGDGENYQVGWLDAADTPYMELVAAGREVGAMLYATAASVVPGQVAQLSSPAKKTDDDGSSSSSSGSGTIANHTVSTTNSHVPTIMAPWNMDDRNNDDGVSSPAPAILPTVAPV